MQEAIENYFCLPFLACTIAAQVVLLVERERDQVRGRCAPRPLLRCSPTLRRMPPASAGLGRSALTHAARGDRPLDERPHPHPIMARIKSGALFRSDGLGVRNSEQLNHLINNSKLRCVPLFRCSGVSPYAQACARKNRHGRTYEYHPRNTGTEVQLSKSAMKSEC
jgi:hypothetical protein